MTSVKKIPENILFVPRGVIKKQIDFKGFKVQLEIKVLTNKEADKMKEGFIHLIGEEVEADTAGIAEEIIKVGLLDINTTFEGKDWKSLDTDEKGKAVESLHPDLRDLISKEIIAKTNVTGEEKGFLSKR